MIGLRTRLSFGLWLLLAAGQVHGQGAPSRHPFGMDDYSALRSATAIAVAPDAGILYRVDFGGASGPTRHEWRLMASDGSRSHKLELPDNFTPFGFTPDGALYGGYTVEARQQLAIVPVAGGAVTSTPSRIILLPSGIRSASLSPDGARFAVVASAQPPDPFATIHTVIQADHSSLYVVNADGTGGGWWCPSLADIADGPLAGGPIAWSPDSATLAVVSQTPKIGFHDLRSFIDVCSAGGTRRVAEIANAVSGIAWSAGRELAFLSTTTNVLTPDHVWTVPAAGGAPTDRTPSLAGSALSLSGDPRGKVWVVVARGVQNEVDSFEQGKLTTVFRWPAGTILAPPKFSELASAPGQLAFAVGDPQHAVNVAVPAGAGLQKITTEGDDRLASVDLGEVRVGQVDEPGRHRARGDRDLSSRVSIEPPLSLCRAATWRAGKQRPAPPRSLFAHGRRPRATSSSSPNTAARPATAASFCRPSISTSATAPTATSTARPTSRLRRDGRIPIAWPSSGGVLAAS